MNRAYIDALMDNNDVTEPCEDSVSDAAERFERAIRASLVPSRETSLALARLEEAVMWAERSASVNGVM